MIALRTSAGALVIGCLLALGACAADDASPPGGTEAARATSDLPPGWASWPLDGAVAALEPADSGTAWAAAGGQLWHFDGETWTVRADQLPGGVMDLAVAPDGTVWVGSSEGVAAFDGTSWRRWGAADGLPFDQVFALTVDRDGTPWASTADYVVPPDDSARALPGGVSRFDGSQWITLGAESGVPAIPAATAGEIVEPFEGGIAYVVTTLESAPDGVWLGWLVGSCLLAGDRCGIPDLPVSATPPAVYPDGIAADPDGGVVFLTSPLTATAPVSGTTLVVFDGTRWSTLEGPPPSATSAPGYGTGVAAGGGDVVYLVLADAATDLELAAVAGTLWAHDTGGWSEVRSPDGFVSDSVTAVEVAADGVVWIGTGEGVARLVPGEVSS